MRRATRVVAALLGLFAGIGGPEHGYFEILRGNVRPDGFVIAHLGVALGLEGFEARFDAREVCKALASANPAFAGIDLDAVGDGGRPLAGVGEAREGSSG